MNSRTEHWQLIYRTKDPATLSWHQAEPRLSRELIAATGPKFSLRRSETEWHRTPGGPEQEFVYCWFEAEVRQSA